MRVCESTWDQENHTAYQDCDIEGFMGANFPGHNYTTNDGDEYIVVIFPSKEDSPDKLLIIRYK